MKRIPSSRLLAFSFALLILGMLLLSSASAASPTSGYVTYQISLNKQGSASHSFLVNYSSANSNQNGYATLTLGIVSSMQNLTYSKLVNVSSLPEIFPYIPGVTNQSFSYSTHNVSISARISSAGSSSITFKSMDYNAQKYLLTFSLTNSSSGETTTADGYLLALPSGLLYSVEIQESGATINVQLIATNLPLNDPSNAISTTEGTALVGVGILGAAALAIPWRLRKRKNSETASSEKPSYWVD